MKTINLEGIEYVLIPKDQLQPKPSDSAIPQQTPQESPPGSILEDFIGKPLHSYPPESQIIPKTPSISKETVKIVDATSKLNVPKAQPKIYEYFQRFKNKRLTPMDVIGFAGMNRKLTSGFKDVDEIEADKRRPERQRFFYGPGIEQDIPSVI